jgi:hydroxymethylpyrimidine pyrophosphatase-like HAD family hydrolase
MPVIKSRKLGLTPNTQRYPERKVIAIDVDGTLITRGQVNTRLVEWAKDKHDQGYKIIIWSARGEDHARTAAQMADLSSIATAISKPGYIVDDQGWQWIKHTKVITSLDSQ